MKYAIIFFIAAMLVGWSGPVPDTASATGGCTGKQVFAESQSWWAPAPGASKAATSFGHIHVGACIPERDSIKADTSIKIRIIMHNNPGRLLDLSLVLKGRDTEVTVAKLTPPRRTCPVTETCTFYVTAPIKISKFEASGLQEVRFRAYVDEPDGKRMHTSLNWQAYIANGKPREDVTRLPFLRAKGWYTGYGYCEADILTTPLPDKPVSGNLVLKVRQVDHGSTDVDPSHHVVSLDSDAHAGIPGKVLFSGTGALPATSAVIDTTKLSNGTHRLSQRVDCQKGEQINSGVLVFLFDVANPVS